MPAFSAASVGALNACRSISATAIPLAPLVTALFIALTIWLTLLFPSPSTGTSSPSSLHASAAPYWVGVKNGLVVTWLTNTNLYFGCEPKTFEPSSPPLDALAPARRQDRAHRAGGHAGQRGAAQERAPVEPGPVGIPGAVEVLQTLHRFVGLVGV